MRNVIKYTIEECLSIDKLKIVEQLKGYVTSHQLPVGELQITAWEDCIDFLQQQLGKMQGINKKITLIFEYMLPLEKGRRPDVILMVQGKIIILEFKGKANYQYQDIEQVIGYREDIKHFHEDTVKCNLEVIGFLVLTKTTPGTSHSAHGVPILTKDNFKEVIESLLKEPMNEHEINEWLNSKYYPVPSIVESTHKLFFEGRLPYIKSIAEGDIAQAVRIVANRITEGEKKEDKRLIFVSGVPGAGKTLVGLQTVYDYSASKYQATGHPIKAIYLSGNGPLVNVLQTQLSTGKVNGIEGKAYVQGMLNFKRDYLGTSAIPEQTVIVFDEAQRAWDPEKMKKPYSEAEALLRIGDKVHKEIGHVTIICLIGEGQAIHTGEEKGMQLWREAVEKVPGWHIYAPPKYEGDFIRHQMVTLDSQLYLDTSIRTNFVDISKWIEAVLEGDKDTAYKEFQMLMEQGFIVRCTREFKKVERVVEKLVMKYPERKAGLLVSSKVDDFRVKQYTKREYQTSFIRDREAGQWFLEDCIKLEKAASEFLCQGLEIDMPIILFGGDYRLINGEWYIDENVRRKNKDKYDNIEVILKNIYRVLLSRGRKGMVLFIPNERMLDETYEFFRKIGVPEI